jgi:hypothetical protein
LGLVDTQAMALNPSLDGAPNALRRGASRPTIVLGYAAIGGLIGKVAGAAMAFNLLGLELPDNTDGLAPAVMVAAGLGWLVGAGFGSIAGMELLTSRWAMCRTIW